MFQGPVVQTVFWIVNPMFAICSGVVCVCVCVLVCVSMCLLWCVVFVCVCARVCVCGVSQK